MASSVVPLKQYLQHSVKNISGNIKAVFFKIDTRNVHVHHNLPRIEINDSLIHEVLQG